ncbi:MAG: hypothetical protein ABIT07_02520 [Ferruginibacter sp.]
MKQLIKFSGLFLVVVIAFASCKKEVESNASQQVTLTPKTEIFNSLTWSLGYEGSGINGVSYIEMREQILDVYSSWLQQHVKVELIQEGETIIHVLPYVQKAINQILPF